ncbi:MAG: DUF4080 domain-containing protein [Clostridia bacterium]|nr:DUF4080 domain-containing protein [Clostridia bacterium]
MKLLIVALNAKYVHTNLAVRYLYQVSEKICDVEITEFSINDNVIAIEREILKTNSDVVAFSCYIWNIEMIKNIASDIKKSSGATIIFGGPEVSYDSTDFMKDNSFVDYIIKGEGEIVFPKLIKYLSDHETFPDEGLAFRQNGNIFENKFATPVMFDRIPFPYNESDCKSGKILYYESSRGCPYSCKYCLSGENKGVRFKNVDEVKHDLTYFDNLDVQLVKFVDRTFNADKKRACEIWKHISSLKGNTRFHMEITGEILDDETVGFLEKVNAEKLQFEIGVQTTNHKTLDAINRKCNTDKLFSNIKKLIEKTDIHIHLDLIAGLPYEDISSFEKSFNDVLSLRPHVLQLGFLKLLKGSAMRDEAENHDMIYRDYAPYEIISNKYINHKDIMLLKDIDFVFDKIYNSGDFVRTIDFLFEKFENKFSVFKRIVHEFDAKGLMNKSFSKAKLFDEIFDVFSYFGSEFEEVLRFDYITALHPGKMPRWSRGDDYFRMSESVYDFLKNEEIKKDIMPMYFNVPAKMLIKHFRFEKFTSKIVAFDYKTNLVYDVTSYISDEKQ